MKNIFDAVKGGNFAEISQGLNAALGGKLDTVIQNAGGMLQQAEQKVQGSSVKQAAQGVSSTASNAFGSLGSMNGVGGLLGATAVGGVLGALFGGKKAMKKAAKGAVLVGGTAAAGALAWKFYQKWAEGKGQGTPAPSGAGQFGDAPPAVNPAPAPASTVQDTTALILLEAMVFAARADGHIDDEEQAYIQNAVTALFPDQEMASVLNDMLVKPIDPQVLAAKVSNFEEGLDLYRLSCAAINVDSFMERSYLDGLAKALKIDEAQKNALEHEAAAVRASMGE